MQKFETLMIGAYDGSPTFTRHGVLVHRALATPELEASVYWAYRDLRQRAIIRFEDEQYRINCSLKEAFEFASNPSNDWNQRAIVNVCLHAALIDLGKEELGKTIAGVVNCSLHIGSPVSDLARALLIGFLEEVER